MPVKSPIWKNWWFWLVLFIFFGRMMYHDRGITQSSINNTESASQVESQKPSEPPNPPEPQTEADASNVHIKVLGMETMDVIKDEYDTEKPQGIFKIVRLSIKNNQRDEITVDDSSFKLLDDQKREFSSSGPGGSAFRALDRDKNKILSYDGVNPGNTLEGYIVFDVPKDAKGFVLQARGGFTGSKVLLKVE